MREEKMKLVNATVGIITLCSVAVYFVITAHAQLQKPVVTDFRDIGDNSIITGASEPTRPGVIAGLISGAKRVGVDIDQSKLSVSGFGDLKVAMVPVVGIE